MKSLRMKNVEYNSNAILKLEIALKCEKNLRTYKRVSVVLKHYKGFSNVAIAEMEGITVHSVAKYIKAYKSEGVAALTTWKSPEAPRNLSKDQGDQLLKVIIENTPDKVGFDSVKN